MHRLYYIYVCTQRCTCAYVCNLIAHVSDGIYEENYSAPCFWSTFIRAP